MECCFHFCTSENLVNETRVVKPGKLEQLSLLCLQSDWLKTVLDENNRAKPMEMFELFPQQYFPPEVIIFPCLSTESFTVCKVLFLNFFHQHSNKQTKPCHILSLLPSTPDFLRILIWDHVSHWALPFQKLKPRVLGLLEY